MNNPVLQPHCLACNRPIALHDPLTRCAHCGQPFDPEKLLRPLFIGRNVEYYEREFGRMETEKPPARWWHRTAFWTRPARLFYRKAYDNSTEKKTPYVSWNRAAFWMGPEWLFYRKMYGYGFLYLLFAFLLSLVPVLLSRILGMDSSVSFLSIPLWFFLFYCFFDRGNTLYHRHLKGLIQKMLSLEGAKREKFLKRHGGTSLVGPVILYSLVALALLVPLLIAIFS